MEFGVQDGIPLHDVTGAVFLMDGSLVVADAGNHRLLHVSERGELLRTLGRRGGGPGEFESITALFATDATALAYDGMQSRVTVWSLSGNPSVHRLPLARGQPTSLVAVASASEWLLTADAPPEVNTSGLVEERASILTYDPDRDRATEVDVRRLKYGYVVWRRDAHGQGSTRFRMSVLGSAQIAGKEGRWFLAPLDRAMLEIRGGAEGSMATELQLPIEDRPYSVEELRRERDDLMSISSNRHARLLAQVYTDVEEKLPAKTPAARRMLAFGGNVWVAPFGRREDGKSAWLVIDPSEPKVLATVVMEAETTLLGGSGSAVAVLTRTYLGEEVVSVRSILRP